MYPTPFYIYKAVQASFDTKLNRFKHGCTIYNNKNILSIGHNIPHRVPSLSRFGYNNKKMYLHAESDAILKCNRSELKGSNLLVVRAKHNKLCNSKPCQYCMALILEVEIGHVYYSNVYGNIIQLF
jgi:deoxycytidylate deaminase